MVEQEIKRGILGHRADGWIIDDPIAVDMQTTDMIIPAVDPNLLKRMYNMRYGMSDRIDNDVRRHNLDSFANHWLKKSSIISNMFESWKLLWNNIRAKLYHYDHHEICNKCGEERIRRAENWNEVLVGGSYICQSCLNHTNGFFRVNGQMFKIDINDLSVFDMWLVFDVSPRYKEEFRRFEHRCARQFYSNERCGLCGEWMSMRHLNSSIHSLNLFLHKDETKAYVYIKEFMKSLVNKADNHRQLSGHEKDFYNKLIPKVGCIIL